MTRDGRAVDGSIDRLRAVAIVGIVTGHWLVTVIRPADGSLVGDSALRYLPDLTPMTWVLQTLAPMFCAAGFVAARAVLGRDWFVRRLRVLARGVGGLVSLWVAVALVLLGSGATLLTIGTVGRLVLDPLWFLGVLVSLWLATPLLVRLDRRLGWWASLPPLLLVAAADLTGTLAPAAVVGAWAAAYLVGVRLARGGRASASGIAAVAVVAVAAAAALVLLAGYPASAVGVTGEERSNLGPPSLFVVCVGAGQLGVFLAVRRRWGTGPAGRLVTGLSRRALPIFLWHQSALLLLVLTSAVWGPRSGLVGVPDSPLWVLQRVAWLPVLVAVTAGFVVLSGWSPRGKPVASREPQGR